MSHFHGTTYKRGYARKLTVRVATGVFVVANLFFGPPASASEFTQGGGPWEQAVSSAQELLGQNPDFEDHLREYPSIAADVNRVLDMVQRAEPALSIVDDLRGINILGLSGWDALKTALDSSTPGAGEALESLDGLVRDLLDLRGKLARLGEVGHVLEAAAAFRTNPSEATLRAWAGACETGIELLNDVEQAIASQTSTVDDAVVSVRLVQQALAMVGSVPGVDVYVGQVNGAISSLSSPLFNLQEALNSFKGQVQDDVRVMEEVIQIVETAERTSTVPSTATSSDRGTGRASPVNGILPVFLGVGAVVIVGLLVFLAQRRHRPLPAAVGMGGVKASHGTGETRLGSAAADSQAFLVMETGPLAGQTVRVRGDNILIGRGTGSSIRILDRTISRQHARLRYAAGVWYVQDQGSARGVLLNGRQVEATRLNHGDRVKLGDVTFIFREQGGRG